MASNNQAPLLEVSLRIRMAPSDARYAGGLIDGAAITGLFGDLATELAIRHDGDEGLFRAYEEIEFLAPVGVGDYIEARARLLDAGNTSRRIEFEAYKQITPAPEAGPTAAAVLDEPVLVARAVGTVVVPADRQRLSRAG
jgi:3-aminobutyryl-CoA ammonia-lyase